MLLSNNQQQFEADLRDLLNSAAGRRVLKIILGECNLLKPSFVQKDVQATAYNEGIRSVGLWLSVWIDQASPGELYKILTEKLGDEHGS